MRFTDGSLIVYSAMLQMVVHLHLQCQDVNEFCRTEITTSDTTTKTYRPKLNNYGHALRVP
jgi:hypothetical protein